jgi:hypothetical protein
MLDHARLLVPKGRQRWSCTADQPCKRLVTACMQLACAPQCVTELHLQLMCMHNLMLYSRYKTFVRCSADTTMTLP